MKLQCRGTTWHLSEHAVASRGKGCTRLQMCMDKRGTAAGRVLLVSKIYVCNSGIVLGFARRRRLIDRHEVCSEGFVNLLSKINHFASSVYSAKAWFRLTSFCRCDCCLYFGRRIALRVYLT